MHKPNDDQPVLVLEFEELLELCDQLVKKIGRGPQDTWKLWGLPRNGMIIAGLMAHCGDVGLRASPPFTPSFIDEHTLIVDDIHDSGKTLNLYIARGMPTATLFWREKEGPRPTYFAKVVEDDTWIAFPWEEERYIIGRGRYMGEGTPLIDGDRVYSP